jgi:hypothetical protein
MRRRQTGFFLIIAIIMLVVLLSVVSAQHQTNINNRMTQTADTSSGYGFETIQVQGLETLTAQPTMTIPP